MEPGKKAKDNRRLHCVALDLEMLSDFEVYLTVSFVISLVQCKTFFQYFSFSRTVLACVLHLGLHSWDKMICLL